MSVSRCGRFARLPSNRNSFSYAVEAIVSEDAVPGNTHPMALATAAHTYSILVVVNPARLILPPPTT